MITEEEINPFDSLLLTITSSSKDYSIDKRDIWLYGIIVGWPDECLKSFQERFSWWDDNDTKRLKDMHLQFKNTAKLNNAKYFND